ncbi:MAG: tRNA (guanosine(37)-N1)-methyltransferase TrmD [Deltaproteobacteria bacterium]|nr:tRNA (guanosine(37)-N1)-methyltransferase TrmD [Deltaproteobacteria bacterium]
MKFEVITLFPGFFTSALDQSILKKAQNKALIEIYIHDLRPFGLGPHKVCDDVPYGGGGGMLMCVEPLVKALESIPKVPQKRIILLTPQGEKLTQKKLKVLSEYDQLIIVCGRYHGVDERFKAYIDEEISIGDYVINGGETASLVLIEGVTRLIPGVLGHEGSLTQETFEHDLLGYPQYTRPPVFAGQKVPGILVSGDHKAISQWRKKKALHITRKKRPDLLDELDHEQD